VIFSSRRPTSAISCLVLFVSLLVSCDRTQDGEVEIDLPEVVLAEIPPAMSPGTLRGLGPHIFEATLDQAGDRLGSYPAQDVGVRLAWSELDTYSYREINKGSIVREEIRIGPDLYRRGTDSAPYQRFDGVPGDSIILYSTVQLFDSALGPFDEQVAFDPQPDSTIEGRPVKVWRVTLIPASAPDTARPVGPDAADSLLGRGTKPISLSGLVSVDIETGNRLLVELEGRFLPRSAGGDTEVVNEVHVVYRERRILLNVPEDVFAPSAELVYKPKKRVSPLHLPKNNPRIRGQR
jgi:hypothetical protein